MAKREIPEELIEENEESPEPYTGQDYIDRDKEGEDQAGAVYFDYDEFTTENEEANDFYPMDGSGSTDDSEVAARRAAIVEVNQTILNPDGTVPANPQGAQGLEPRE